MNSRLFTIIAPFVGIILLTLFTPTESLTRISQANPLTCLPSFFDDMDSYNTTLWHKADGWWNGLPFWNGWRADHVEFSGSIMSLRLDDQPCPAGCSGQPYASGEYRTNDFYGYGRIEGRFKAAKSEGIVTSLFTYTGPSDGNPHDEIDIEILGKDTTKMQVNYFTNGMGGHETFIDLGFDASLDFHIYAFEWSPTAINWYVDNTLVHTETISIPTTPGRIMMSLWLGTGVDDWLGPFTYTTPIYAYYDWIKYTPPRCVYLPLIVKLHG
jgi:endo-1,3-1,4-beta-glycanase ExoK